MSTQLRSPIPWMGGKLQLAQQIVAQFPPANTYDIFVDAFGGGANVLLTKSAGKHLEVYNDLNGDLVNCWMHLRDHAQEMEEALRTLPYARGLYYQYHRSLYDGTEMPPLERAVRWYYVLVSSFRPDVNETPSGWMNGATSNETRLHAHLYHNRLAKLKPVAERFCHIEIDCRDFEKVIKQFESVGALRTLIYCDPPYIDSEHYYKPTKDIDLWAFHQRLARVLNETPAMVALSYYDNTLLEGLYPRSKWRRVSFDAVKKVQRTKAKHDKADEILLMNYEPAASKQADLWSMPEEREERGA